MKINNYIVLFSILIGFLFSIRPSLGQGSSTSNPQKGDQVGKGEKNISGKPVWTTCPFNYKVFIENKGQYDGRIPARNGTSGQPDNKILFGAQLGSMFVYFTKRGIVYRYDELVDKDGKPIVLNAKGGGDPDADGPPKDVPYYLSATWKDMNPGATVTMDGKLSSYYTFPNPKKTAENKTIKTWAYTKITYHNIYQGIDAEYSFVNDKEGFKYTLIVHPGADVSKVKLAYKGAKNLTVDSKGNMNVECEWGGLIDHAPVCRYEENNNAVVTNYSIVNNNTETFNSNNSSPGNTLVIDPWVTVWTKTNPIIATNKGAYDLDYDYIGNVYVYGGNYPYQLVKLNPLGTILWTYSTSDFTFSYYGDFCVDKGSGSCYAVEGFGDGSGSINDKINNAGNLVTSYTVTPAANEDEEWRAAYDLCNHQIVVAGGGTTDYYQAMILDTNLVGSTFVNVLNFPNNSQIYCLHDMCGIAMEPTGTACYMATAKSVLNPTIDSNHIVKMALPTLIPTAYNVSDKYKFTEVGSVSYTGTGVGNANGMNCMAANPNYLCMWDGMTLREFNPGNGAIIASTVIGNTSFAWGGIDMDLCNNIFIGSQTNVEVYNAALSNTGTIGPFPGNVYDVVLGNGVLGYGDSTLYTCGNGFVTRIALNLLSPPKIVKSLHKVCSCNCSAKATLMLCGNPDTVGVSYQWSNGQTTRTATGLCPGNTYTITIEMGCAQHFIDTVDITNSGLLSVTKSQTPPSCTSPGTASVSISGGIPPFVYSWSNGATASSINVSAGTICVSIADHGGCQDTVCFIIPGPPLPTIKISPNPDSMCIGSSVNLTASGGVTYSWTPASGLSCTACPNPTANPKVTTVYVVAGKDTGGCVNRDTVVVKIFPLPKITTTPKADTSICNGGSVNLLASGAVTYTWTPATGLSCTTCPNPTANPSVTTSYSISATDAHGCVNSVSIIVNVEPPPAVTVSAFPGSICQGSSAILTAIGNDITSPYIWNPGNLTGTDVKVSPLVTTTYTVTASSNCNVAHQTITINVNPLPFTDFTADVSRGCWPLCIQFLDNSAISAGNIGAWTWKFGNGDSTSKENPLYCYPKSGIFNVSLTAVSDSGCSATEDLVNMITVFSHPLADFTAAPQPTTILNPTIQFKDKSKDAYGIAYRFWTFGDFDSVNTLENPDHTYRDTGTYCAREVAMNIYGCTDTTTNCIVIEPIFALYIPDAFTPNGDGKNEMFMPKGNDIKTFEMYIFDRWGMQLFHSTDIANGWNGTVNGGSAICQQDIYVYVITVTDNRNKSNNYTGYVNLIK